MRRSVNRSSFSERQRITMLMALLSGKEQEAKIREFSAMGKEDHQIAEITGFSVDRVRRAIAEGSAQQ